MTSDWKIIHSELLFENRWMELHEDKLISDSIQFFGFAIGILFVFLFHIWMDYAWLALTSYLIYRGVSVLNTKFYSALLISISTILVFYGVYIILNIF